MRASSDAAGRSLSQYSQLGRSCSAMVVLTSLLGETYSVSPLPLWERSDRIVRCDPGEGFRTIDRPEPLTPTLSHKGRGSSPSLLRNRVSQVGHSIRMPNL